MPYETRPGQRRQRQDEESEDLASRDSSYSQGLLMAKHQQSEGALAAASHILDRGEAAALSEKSGREMSCRIRMNARWMLVVKAGDEDLKM